MNREIKFRVWNPKLKHLMDWSEVKEFGIDLFDDVTEYWPLMQYTGLKDKNGNEIYEGDILSFDIEDQFKNIDCTNPSDVIFSETNLQWNVRVDRDSTHGLPLNWGGYEFVEVVGNIYENPELLTPSIDGNH